jgi:CRISPR-associated protein (TIGR02710 family)
MDFKEKVSYWRSLPRNSTEASSFYWHEIFPEALESFRQKSGNLTHYRFVISTVGLTPEPIVLFLKAIQPERALFLCTDDSEKYLDLILQKSELGVGKIEKRVVTRTDVTGVYQAIKDFVLDKTPSEILIDATGGKKPVIGAAALAGNFLGIDVGYVDYTEYLDDLRIPKPGTEFPRVLENPLVVFGDFEIEKAKDAFNHLNFSGAEEILNVLEGTIEDIWLVRTLRCMNEAYASLDSFEYEKAEKKIEDFFDLPQRRSFPNIEQNLTFYLEVVRVLKDKTHEKYFPYLSLHFLFAGFRFAEQGRYDLAVFFMYRVIELVLSALAKMKYGLDPSRPDYSAVPAINKEAYREKHKEIFGRLPSKELPFKLGLMDQAIMLKILKEEVVAPLNLKDLRGITDLRNESIFTHGLSVLREADYNQIRRMARKLLDDYHTDKELAVTEKFRTQFEFPKI